MKPFGKLLALWLLLAVVSPAVPVYGFVQSRAPKAACHEHGRKAPAHNPVTYQCCQAGHRIAAVREAVNLEVPLLKLCPVVESAVLPSVRSLRTVQSHRFLASSTDVISLRI